MITVYEKRLIKELRDKLKLPDSVEDAEILKKTSGTLTRARVELRLSVSDLWLAMRQEYTRLRNWFF